MVQNKFINRIILNESPAESVIIQTEWHSSQIDFIVLPLSNGTSSTDCLPDALTGKITFNELSKPADHLEIPINDFINETKQALTTEIGLHGFSYTCILNTFKWKKGPITYGEVKLTPRNKFCRELVRTSIDIIVDIRNENQILKTDLVAMNERYTEIKDVLNRHIEEKLQNKKKYLTKFIAILNEKKKKIRELEDQLSDSKKVSILSRKRASPIFNGAFGISDDESEPLLKRSCAEGNVRCEYTPSTSKHIDNSGSSIIPRRRNVTSTALEERPNTSTSIAGTVEPIHCQAISLQKITEQSTARCSLSDPIIWAEKPAKVVLSETKTTAFPETTSNAIEHVDTSSTTTSVSEPSMSGDSKTLSDKQNEAVKRALAILSETQSQQNIYNCETQELLENL